ncbi:MAG TPA: uroporphyrinogen decarboxylase [Azospirillaceae bacterium]|nr:uroporphyrinogen decarboxylase [Azospirillaceae bacterium]
MDVPVPAVRQTSQPDTRSKPFLRALAGETVGPVPFWLMRQAGRYLPEYREVRARAGGFLDLCYTPDLAAEVTLQPLRRYGMDAAIIFSDILVVPHGLGQKVWFAEGEGPRLEPVRDAAGLGRLSRADLPGRLAPVYEAVRRVKAQLPDGTALIGFAGAPWTVACYMVEGAGSKEYRDVKGWAYGDPDGFQALIDLLVDATVDHLSLQVEAGAEALQLFDSWAGVLPETAFRRWVVRPTAKIAAALRARHPDVPLIGFPRAAGHHYETYADEAGVTALGLDTTVPVEWAAQRLQTRLPVQGNLDPVMLAVGGAAMEAEVVRILEALGRGPFVFNLGHGILQHTPPQNVAHLARILREWRPAA